MKVLILFSSPADQKPLRLDKEDRIINRLAREFKETVEVERQHASDIEDFHALIIDGGYDIIQFSGHGSSNGIYLEKSDYKGDSGELVSAKRVVNIIALANKCPLLTVFLSCYSDDSLDTLINAAPFVITSKSQIGDEECLVFVQGFYERLFRGSSVKVAFDHAINLLSAKAYLPDNFRLSRRSLIKKGNSLFVESKPSLTEDSILINLDNVRDKIDKLGLDEETVCHLISRKLSVHYWIFIRARDNVTIPIGRLLFGVFWWENSKDVVYCKKLMKLRSDVSQQHWSVWSKLLITYNDLVSSEYRSEMNPASPANKWMLKRAINVFDSHIQRYLIPMRDNLIEMGFSDAIPFLEFLISQHDIAKNQFIIERYPQVVESLELALTNYHEIVDLLQPPEEEI